MQYRTDIDGLRALAVAAITVFHINKYLLPGGFVGVDVFFVISGFLITNHLLASLEKGKFSFSDFYIRRVRRLFPALFAMLIATSVAAPFLLFPSELEKYAHSLSYTSVYLSNMFFLSQSGYFESGSEKSLLLHTWSLAAEEQFYIVFPFVLWLTYRFRKDKVLAIVLTILLVSFALSEFLVRTHPDAAFYISPSRFWQFMCGSVVALIPSPNFLSRVKRELLYTMGIGAVLLSIYVMQRSTPFPGIYAIAPTVGTALIIYAGNVSQQPLLSALPFRLWPSRLIGWASYSIYLWHWPIILYFKMNWNSQPDSKQQILLLLVCVVVGIASWLLIEKPTRKLRLNTPASRRLVWLGVLASIAVSFSYSYYARTGALSPHYPDEAVRFSDFLDYKTDEMFRSETCFMTSKNRFASEYQEDKCIGIAKGKKNILVLGDSHSAHLYAGAVDVFKKAQVSQLTASGCKPVMHTEGAPICVELVNRFYNTYIDKYPFDLVIISSRWNDGDLEPLLKSVEYLRSKKVPVVVLGPVIEYDLDLPRVLALDVMHPEKDFVHKTMRTEKFDLDKKFHQAFKDRGYPYFSLTDVICENGRDCITTADGVPLQFDYGHFTHEGAVKILQRVASQRSFPVKAK